MNHSHARTLRILAVALVLVLPTGCDAARRSRLPFEPFEASDDLVPALPQRYNEVSGYALADIDVEGCDAQKLENPSRSLRSDRDGSSSVGSKPDETATERKVSFETMRWTKRSNFDQAAHEVREALQLPCFSTEFNPRILTEPVDLDGLPDGSVAVRWTGESDSISAVLFDADSQIMMVMTWMEAGPGDRVVPVDDFVNSANQAWSEFLAANPPLE